MASVTIQVLGSGDAFGSGGRLQTCFLLCAGEERVLIDCGATALVAMHRYGIEPSAIDAVFLSHLHGDHFGGLPFLLLEAQFISRRQRPLTVLGPPGTRERVRASQEVLFPGSSATSWRFPLSFVEIAPLASERYGGIGVTAHPVEHPSGAPAYALRLTCGDRVIAYSGDTAWTEQLVEVSRASDLLIVECYASKPNANHHLDFRTLSRRRDELGAKRVLLTHMSAEMLRHSPGDGWETAHDGLLLEL
jgi:ribonuclease BN (tRNA processing enzyme)